MLGVAFSDDSCTFWRVQICGPLHTGWVQRVQWVREPSGVRAGAACCARAAAPAHAGTGPNYLGAAPACCTSSVGVLPWCGNYMPHTLEHSTGHVSKLRLGHVCSRAEGEAGRDRAEQKDSTLQKP